MTIEFDLTSAASVMALLATPTTEALRQRSDIRALARTSIAADRLAARREARRA